MALGFLDTTSGGFRYGEVIEGVFVGVVVTGVGLTYGLDGAPTGGTIRKITFDKMIPVTGMQANSIVAVTLPFVSIADLATAGFDWIAATLEGGGLYGLQIDTLLAAFDGIKLVASDVVVAPAGLQTVYGGEQDDVIYGPAASRPNTDYLTGTFLAGSGNDVISAIGLFLTAHGDEGNDKIILTHGALDIIANSATAYGGTGNDTIRADSDGVTIDGGADNDLLTATWSESALIAGGEGDDKIWLHYSGSSPYGHAVAHGDEGNDTIFGSDGTDFVYGGDGNDLLLTGANSSGTPEGAYGDAGNDKLIGGAGGQLLSGGAGLDTLLGGDGMDILYGGADNDMLKGEAGLDQLFLSGGTDTAYGGADTDYFVFSADGTATTGIIRDFGVTEDILFFDTAADLTAQQSYDAFVGDATQIGADIRYTNGAGLIVILRGVDLDDLTVLNFVDDTNTGVGLTFPG